MNSKKDRQLFVNTLNQFMEQQQCQKEINEFGTTYQMNTSVGFWHIYIENENEHKQVYSIFTRFENEKEAIKIVSCNPYSGKYNFHSNGMEIIAEFKELVELIRR
jgi:hypothetical protein